MSYLQNSVDWSHPLFCKWKLPERLSEAQSIAFLDADDDEIMNAPWTEQELRDVCLNVPCRVALNCGNICLKAENKWCRTSFQKEMFKELTRTKKAQIYERLRRKGTRHYNKCVDMHQVKRKCANISRKALDPYKQARYLKRQYYRIIQLNGTERENSSFDEQSEENDLIICIDDLPEVGANIEVLSLEVSENEILQDEPAEEIEFINVQHSFAIEEYEGQKVFTADSADTVIFTGSLVHQGRNNILSQVAVHDSETIGSDFERTSCLIDPIINENSGGQANESDTSNIEVIYELSSKAPLKEHHSRRQTNVEVRMNIPALLAMKSIHVGHLHMADAEYNQIGDNLTQLSQDFRYLDGAITSTQLNMKE